jgi:transcription initiation factor TFIIB
VEATGISKQDRSTVKLASKYYRMMVMEMGVFTEQLQEGTSPHQQAQPPATAMAIDHYISKLANMAKIDTKVERLAIDIAHRSDDHLLADGKAPNGLAAAYIYVASILLGVNILQRDVSSLSGVTEVTIRNRCKDILTSFKMTVTVRVPQTRPTFT